MSPCIVTTYRNGPWPHTTAMRDVLSRVAVATLEEGELKRRLFNWREGDWLDSRESLLLDVIVTARLPRSGGTVGPLPDGTVIEVEAIGWITLANRALLNDGRRHNNAAILDAFNAQEVQA